MRGSKRPDRSAYFREWRQKNKERIKITSRERRRRNEEAEHARSAAFRQRNPGYMSAWNRKNKAHKNSLTAAYRAGLKKATPAWLSFEQKLAIRALYSRAAELTISTGVVHHVDHQVPINGIEVCGLHVPHNLQVLTEEENCRKKNRYDSPDFVSDKKTKTRDDRRPRGEKEKAARSPRGVRPKRRPAASSR